MAGYSPKPLIEKLGIRQGSTICFVDAPEDYIAELGPLPISALIVPQGQPADFIHAFYTSHSKLVQDAPDLVRSLKLKGILWVSWPKRASGVQTEVTEHSFRNIFIPLGLVDVKVAAVTNVWSGLKFVRRLRP